MSGVRLRFRDWVEGSRYICRILFVSAKNTIRSFEQILKYPILDDGLYLEKHVCFFDREYVMFT